MWVPVQIYLSNHFAIYTVEMDTDTAELRCDCGGFNIKGSCAHQLEVSTRIELEGDMPLMFSEPVTAEELRSNYRETMLHKSKIGVLSARE